MYVDPRLDDIPVAVADRTATVQDTSCALPGTMFPVEGDAVRLFMQWGEGLPAQHLDMDLSCRICFGDGKAEACAFYRLQATGARHSGDIREIPDRVGTAEYIELQLSELQAAKGPLCRFHVQCLFVWQPFAPPCGGLDGRGQTHARVRAQWRGL